MPHRKKKPFIEKKKAVSFHLVHRSQRDPLAADETAPQRVLLPTQKINDEERRAEQRKYGVFFDDDYDYLQHLKETSGPSELVPIHTSSAYSSRDEKEETSVIPSTGIKLPSSVFASEFEEDIGLLNKAAPVSGPRLDFDPDIVAALDDDFDFSDPDNVLEDDFILQANKPTEGEEGTDILKSGSEDNSEWEDMDDETRGGSDNESDGDSTGGEVPSPPGKPREAIERHLFWEEEEETKSRFTEYSMTSSVMRRNEQLTLHDERFEKFYEQYDDDEIGALDNAELEGSIQIDSNRLQEVLNDYHKKKAENCIKLNTLEPFEDQDLMNELDESEEEIVTVVLEEAKEKWDCESICSTYSNLYNHPQLITYQPKPKKIHISSKTGIPLHVLPKKGLTARQAERMQMINGSDLPRVATQPRSKHESKEDKRARKQAIREERKERRVEKKANKLAFKLEKRRQEKELLNLKRNIEDGNQLFPCEVCGRCFAADVLKRHGPICKKLFYKKRKPFNSLKQRLQGTDIPSVRKAPQSKTQAVRKSNWRQEHEDFIKAVRSAKECVLTVRKGRPLPPPLARSVNPDYIQCPYCMRKFNETAASRHINFCQDQSSHRVFDPAQTAAKLASRAQSKAQTNPRKEPTVTSAVQTLLQNRAMEAQNDISLKSGLATDTTSGANRQGFSKSSKKD